MLPSFLQVSPTWSCMVVRSLHDELSGRKGWLSYLLAAAAAASNSGRSESESSDEGELHCCGV